MKTDIFIKGAKEHNLKNIDITIPRNKFTVVTGLSGSGKSSLAFDTIYAEGQRRYVESLSSYARQFLGQMEKPNVESIEGLSPAISIDQKSTSKNPRSTVGTITEVYDYLRLLYSRVGTPYCPICDREIKRATIDDIVEDVLMRENGTKLLVLSPVIRGKKGTHKTSLSALKRDGFLRVIVNGEERLLEEDIVLDKKLKHSIYVVVDRLIIKDEIRSRLVDSIETALSLEENLVMIDFIGEGVKTYSMNFACPDHGAGIEEMEPRAFSFNSPFGACDSCKGLGYIKAIDPDLIIPDRSLSLMEGAVAPFKASKRDGIFYSEMISLVEQTEFTVDTPINEFSKEALDLLLYGTSGKLLEIKYKSGKYGKRIIKRRSEGIINALNRRYHQTHSNYMRDEIEKYMSETPCSTCNGSKLKAQSLAVKINGKSIIDITNLSIMKAYDFFDKLKLTGAKKEIASEILKEIRARLKFLIDVGLDYLSLSRRASTLSGGEAQRIRLATQIGSGLVGIMYILDEPSIGLHQKDNARLISSLKDLTSIGNTLIVVEHDEETIRTADHIIDIGPGAGIHGGEVVAEGSYKELKKFKNSVTADYLFGRKKIEVPEKRRTPRGYIGVRGANANNLKNLNIDIPVGVFTCITGVSGSGKSSLVNETLYPSIHSKVYGNSSYRMKNIEKLENWESINKVISIDQSPIGRTPRSNPATYTKVFDHIRDLFSALPESKMRGYKKGRFSFNVKGGRCEACSGDGINKIEMHFLPDIYVKCETCGGKRYNKETLEVKYKGKNIYDVLNMSIDEAYEFFGAFDNIKSKIKTLKDVGLGYIKLGQPSTQLSGGEAQRVKLSSELSKRSTGSTLYILDEPTTGLHMADVDLLIHVLHRLVDAGNTIVVIEHNLDVIKSADHIIDLGPDGGERGGKLVAAGTPEEVSKIKASYTGEYLKKVL
ncbi:MAG: excinuclease ABC subunit A [Clostridiales bacterium]|nr:MAG: excinuclease ABC subunit A [Clostridiales bacterium]